MRKRDRATEPGSRLVDCFYYYGFNEVKLNSGKRDRANQEVFLHENPVALTNLPLGGLNKLWLKKHKSSLKLNSTKNVSVENYIKKDKSKAQFLE